MKRVIETEVGRYGVQSTINSRSHAPNGRSIIYQYDADPKDPNSFPNSQGTICKCLGNFLDSEIDSRIKNFEESSRRN